MNRLAATLVFAVLAAACGGESAPSPSPSNGATASSPAPSPTPEPSPSPSQAASPTPEPEIQLPSDAPTTYPVQGTSTDVPLKELVPPGAQVTNVWRLPSGTAEAVGLAPQIALTWTRGTDPLAAEHGFEVWQQFPDAPPWRVVYAFTDPVAARVLGIRFEPGNFTGERAPDVLTFEDQGGSGGCGVWRVVELGTGFGRAILRRQTCDAQMRPVAGTLEIRAAVYEPGDAHCCPSAYRTTTLRWDGAAWEVVDKVVAPASP